MDWPMLVLAICGPLFVGGVAAAVKWGTARVRVTDKLSDRLDALEDRSTTIEGSVRQLREDLRDLRRALFRPRGR